MKESPLTTWLRTESCQEVLRRCAMQVRRRIKTLGLAETLLPWDDPQELVGELWSFAAELRGAAASELAHCLAEENPTRFCFTLARSYISKILDKKRTAAHSTWHAYYRHVRQVLSSCPGVAYTANASGSYYAFTDSPKMEMALLGPEDFKTWPHPSDISGPKRQHEIIALAKFFYRQVKSKFGEDRWVAIRDLCAYIGAQFPQVAGDPKLRLSLQDIHESELSKLEELPQASSALDPNHSITEKELLRLAQLFVKGLDERSKKIFYLKYGEDRTLKEIAKDTGFKGESGVSYQLSLVEASLRNMCLMWPGLSPEDLNEAMFEDFIGKILEFCKSWHQGR